MPKEIKHFAVQAINKDGFEISMTIVERDGALILLNGLGQSTLSLSDNWTAAEMESEIKRLSGVTRLVVMPIRTGPPQDS